jgi:hypothetical protein
LSAEPTLSIENLDKGCVKWKSFPISENFISHLMHRVDRNHDQDVHDIVRVEIIIQAAWKPFFGYVHCSDGTAEYRNSVLKEENKEKIDQIMSQLLCGKKIIVICQHHLLLNFSSCVITLLPSFPILFFA